MSIKCEECAATSCIVNGERSEVTTFCVQCKKVLCHRCVGRLHVPESGKTMHSLEELDMQHQDVQILTTFLLNFVIFVWAAFSLYGSELGNNLFMGTGICPALGQGRQWLARFDANIFYYFKASLALYCDIEDSFWRFLIDGWVRGVVTSSDSLLLLFSQLPKALLFKTSVLTLMRMVVAFFYAAVAVVFSYVLFRFEDGLREASGSATALVGSMHRGSPFFAWLLVMFNKLGAIRKKLRVTFDKVFSIFQKERGAVLFQLRLLCIGIAISGLLRLALRMSPARLVGNNASMADLAIQPTLFFYLASLCTWVDLKLNKLVPKKTSTSAAPITKWRERPDESYLEFANYAWDRFARRFTYYKAQAESILSILVDDAFNLMVVFRLFNIVLNFSAVLRPILKLVGFSGILARYREWFQASAGFLDQPAGDVYLSERLFRMGYSQAIWGATTFGSVTLQEWIQELGIMGLLWNLLWRLLLPVAIFWGQRAFYKMDAKQKAQFKKDWEGANKWHNGKYKDTMLQYGAFWNAVPVEEWVPTPPATGDVIRRKSVSFFDFTKVQ